MERENLKCNATNCAFNKRMECSAGAINIRGAYAITSNETNCSSYVDRISNSFINSIGSQRTNPSNIRCEAQKCTYNKKKNCIANNVIIDTYNASCHTFVCK